MILMPPNGPVSIPAAAFEYDVLRISLDNAMIGTTPGRYERAQEAIASARNGIIYEIQFDYVVTTPGNYVTAVVDGVLQRVFVPKG